MLEFLRNSCQRLVNEEGPTSAGDLYIGARQVDSLGEGQSGEALDLPSPLGPHLLPGVRTFRWRWGDALLPVNILPGCTHQTFSLQLHLPTDVLLPLLLALLRLLLLPLLHLERVLFIFSSHLLLPTSHLDVQVQGLPMEKLNLAQETFCAHLILVQAGHVRRQGHVGQGHGGPYPLRAHPLPLVVHLQQRQPGHFKGGEGVLGPCR